MTLSMAPDDEQSNSSRAASQDVDRAAILAPAVTSVITALGGQQNGKYVLGDEVYGCLKDLKKFWRKDDTDDERTVARIFWKARLLQNDLIPILLETAGKGNVEDRCAIICAELMTSMTWPIDMASELMELDEELDAGTDFTALLQSHLSYKAALLQPGILQALFGIMLPCLAKTRKERKERDGQIINIILHLFRNLAFIKDPPSNSHLSTDQAEYSALQSKLITTLSKTHILDALITLAVNAENDPLFNSWNTILLETIYLLFRGVQPSTLVKGQMQVQKDGLSKLLALEDKRKRNFQRNAPSRHSQFGTTIAVKAGDTAMILHSQEAIKKEARDIIDGTKKMKHQKAKALDELGSQENLTPEALNVLQTAAREFVGFCFNPFLSLLLKDIRSERPKITEKDNLRLLFVTKWFLEFFLSAKEKNDKEGSNWSPDFPMVAQVVDRTWIVWVLRRMRGALDEKPKQWVELQAGIECLTQFLLLIDAMSSAPDQTLVEAAEVLQHQLYYNGEILDLAIESVQGYKEQSVAYLDSSIHLSYVLLRMLEKWGKKKGDVYVRRRKTKAKNKRSGKGVLEEEGIVDMADAEDETNEPGEAIIEEQMFTFDKFEAKFASEDIAHTLLVYLARFRELSTDHMKRVVALIHRQAVKAKAEGLFFKVSTLDLFKSILAEQTTLPRTQPCKDLVQLINYILRQFFKAVEKEPFLVVEAFFPKNRGMWKAYSSWQPEKRDKASSKAFEETWKHPPDVKVKKGYSWSEQLGIAIACLLENDQKKLIDWMKEILLIVIGMRQRIVEETDNKDKESDDDIEDLNEDEKIRREASRLKGPSAEALAKFEDYLIPYITDEQADAATKNPHFKLVCRLVKFALLDENADELEWYVPAAIAPSDLQGSLDIINQYLEKPLELEGKKATQLLTKQGRRRTRRRVASSGPESDADHDDERPKRKERKKKEEVKYKSAQFIEDSDAELGDDEEFFQKEAALRERTALAATGMGGNMKSAGTKKRKISKKGDGPNKKKWRNMAPSNVPTNDDGNSSDSASERLMEDVDQYPSDRRSNSTPATTPDEPSSRSQPRPRPRPKFTSRSSPSQEQSSPSQAIEETSVIDSERKQSFTRPRPRPKFATSKASDSEEEPEAIVKRTTKRKAILVSDEEEM